MNSVNTTSADARSPERSAPDMAMIRRRHVFYVEGYDPQGAEGYYDLFRRSWKRFRGVWNCETRLGELSIDSDEVAHWDIEMSGPNWHVATRYEFLRLERVLNANMAQPMWRQVARSLAWMVDDLITGTTLRILRAAWRFGCHLIYFQALLLLWLEVAIAAGWLAADLAVRFGGLPLAGGLVLGVAVAIGSFTALRPLAGRMHVIQINNCWPYLREFGRGRPSCFDAPIEACAGRVLAAARANAVDEIVVVGHSAAGVTAPAVMARALALDPELARHGPRIVLLTLGSIMPGVALHPTAGKMRDLVRRLALEPSVDWIDCQSRKDVMNFWEFDPVGGVGVDLGAERRNPLVWLVRFKDMVSRDYYQRIRLSFFRLHYQFIMSSDRRAPYDYVMLVAGPLGIAEWAAHHDRLVAAFAADATFVGAASEPAPAPP
jgi:hypothetical protein